MEERVCFFLVGVRYLKKKIREFFWLLREKKKREREDVVGERIFFYLSFKMNCSSYLKKERKKEKKKKKKKRKKKKKQKTNERSVG